MKSGVAVVAALTVASLVGSILAPANARAAPPMWLATHGRTRLLLFGSVHLLPEALDWAPAELTRAEAHAATLWFEMPIDAASDAAARRQSLAKGLAPVGSTLFSMIPPPVGDKVRRAASALGVPPTTLASLRPWLADVSLTLRADVIAGGRTGGGVERQVQAAVPLSIERRWFETASQQIDFLAEAPVADQIASLEATADEILERPWTYRTVVREWLGGDLEGLRRDALEPLWRVSPHFFDRLITSRNRRWALVLRREARPGLSLVVVGMGHMIGSEGLPELLRREGFAVKRLGAANPRFASD